MAAAAGDSAARPLQSAMKLANGAIELDAGNRPREAYTEYLRSIHYISQALLEEAETNQEASETVPPDTSKMLKLAGQCLERAQSTAAKLGKMHLKPAMPVAAPVPSPASRHRRVCSDEGGKLSPFLPPEIFQKLQVVDSQSSKKELTPLEEASLQNQKLKATYEARMARLDPSQAMQKTSLTLSLQRQMMENLVIAKAREETLQRKMEERRLRLQEAANRRFCSQVALTPEEREQRALYAAILEYEQDHDWPKHWKTKLKRNPGDLSLVTNLVSHLLSLPDHPISQLLKKLQCAVYSALYPVVSQGALSTASAPDRLLSLTLLAFESLNTATCKDRCLACIEEPFFSPLWPLLLALYRSVHCTQEAALRRSMELYRNAPPTALGIPAKLLPQHPEAQGATTYPYSTAVQELGLLVLESCPQKKLECIGICATVRTLRAICVCAEEYCHAQEATHQASSQPPAAAIGADDLLPILSFVVLRSGLPQLVSECAALEEFTHEGYLIGEEGYCLTSLQSALSYVELLPRGALGK
ncbi:VPS9 domain-containing protein 1 isoform X7 [Sciurus carolinensis]|uniref:VPS9 domain-containing protein 1 isoform X7 n=1 Tax=Sciurus carolinensis TaxID=30640 RepID=UPI001FB3A5FE|nr:VPS9 domain-containing protein 1 isoform X7 [Sciurus carolinensis]